MGKISKKITTTAIADLFGSQADHLTAELSVLIKPWSDKIRSGEWPASFTEFESFLASVLFSRKWVRGSSGWNALFSPQTPLEKMFQIYIVNLLQHRDFSAYSVLDHEIEMEAMEKGLAQARHYALQHVPEIQELKKEGKASGIKDAMMVAFSHMLPCGYEEDFPASVKHLGGNQLALYNVLFRNGMMMQGRQQNLTDLGHLCDLYQEAIMASGRGTQMGIGL
jgi:hypothetical protein